MGVYEKIFAPNIRSYGLYVIIYCIVCGVLGWISSLLVPPQAAVVTQQKEEEDEDVEEDDGDDVAIVYYFAATLTEAFADNKTMTAALTKQYSWGQDEPEDKPKRLRDMWNHPVFLFLMFSCCYELAFSFSFIGFAGVAAQSNGMQQDQVAGLMAMIGISAALGRVLLGMTADVTRRWSKYLGVYFNYLVCHIIYALALAAMVFKPDSFPIAALLCFGANGATQALVPQSARGAFGPGPMGKVCGILYLFMTFGYLTWDRVAPASIQKPWTTWFAISGCFMVGMVVVNILIWIRSWTK